VATDLYKGVLFNDGEALTTTDLNDTQKYMGARVFDQLVAKSVGNWGAIIQPTLGNNIQGAPFLYALRAGQGFIVAGAGAREVTCSAGTIFQSLGAANGNEAQLLAYTLAGNDFTLTLGVGDATNPRVDVIQVALAYAADDTQSRDFEDDTTELLSSQNQSKKRRVTATFTVKQGTPAATPTFPTLDAGCSALGAVYVPATYNATFLDGGGTTAPYFMDTRYPLKVEYVDVLPSQMFGTAFTNTFSTPFNFYRSSGAGTAFIPCPVGPDARILGLMLWTQQTDGAVSDWTAATIDSGGATVADVFASLGLSSNSTAPLQTSLTHNELRDAMASTITPFGTANAAGLGTPCWGQGFAGDGSSTAGPALAGGSAGVDSLRDILALRLTCSAANCDVFRARWFFARGF
jgi:hypothetical protein